MVLTYEQRIALLAKAREAKKAKKEQADALKPVPVKGRPKKVTNKNVTLDLVEAPPASADVDDSLEIKDEEIKDMIKPSEEEIKEIKKIENTGNASAISKRTSKKKQSQIEPETEPEIIEEVEIRKVKKPKKRIIRKIIKEQYDSESTEEEYEEVVYQAPKRSQKKKIQQATEYTPPKEHKEPEIKTNTSSGFNLFSY